LLPPEPSSHVSDRKRSWGSSLQGFFPLQSLRSLSATIPFLVLALLRRTAVTRPLPHIASPSRLYSLQGSDTAADGMNHRQTAAALLVFVPSRDFLPAAAHDSRRRSLPGLHPCHELQDRGPRAMEEMSLQGIDSDRTGLSLTRLPPLLGFLHLLSKRSVRDSAVPGL